MKMDKKVFVNDQIFESDGDYIIGGFATDQVDNFNYADFVEALRNRIQNLVEVYLEQATKYNMSLGIPNAEQKAKEDCALVISDNLRIEAPYFDTETIVDTLMNDEHTQKWLFEIKYNVKNYQFDTASKYKGINNQSVEMDTASLTYSNAENFTEDCTFEQFIEQLSSIEL
jgi:hypothetical protein